MFTGTAEAAFAALDRYLRPHVIGADPANTSGIMDRADHVITDHPARVCREHEEPNPNNYWNSNEFLVCSYGMHPSGTCPDLSRSSNRGMPRNVMPSACMPDAPVVSPDISCCDWQCVI